MEDGGGWFLLKSICLCMAGICEQKAPLEEGHHNEEI